MKRSLAVICSILVLSLAAFVQFGLEPATGKTAIQTPAKESSDSLSHNIRKIADGVYFAMPNGTMRVYSNSPIIITDEGVLIVDSHVTPAAARALIAAVKTITDKPIRFVVDSHYHFDHSHGNQAFSDDVQIIGHEYTRMKLLGNVLEEMTYKSFASGVPDQIAELKEMVAAANDPGRKRSLELQLRVQEDYLEAMAEIVPTPPNVTLTDKMTLFLGDREIQLLFLGRGHTGGDVVVFLPKEKILCTGDLLVPFLSYMGAGFVDEWDETLEALKALDFETVLPGHGAPFAGKARIEYFQAYLRDLWEKTAELKKEGLSAKEAAKRLDMTAHRAHFPQIRPDNTDVRAVARIYERIDGVE